MAHERVQLEAAGLDAEHEQAVLLGQGEELRGVGPAGKDLRELGVDPCRHRDRDEQPHQVIALVGQDLPPDVVLEVVVIVVVGLVLLLILVRVLRRRKSAARSR